MLHPVLSVGVTGHGVVSRRSFLQRLGGGLTAAGALSVGWRDMLMAQAQELRREGKSMILLWMDGGPSQFESFNPKPGSQYQGPATAIQTRLPGVQVAEYWPQVAQSLDKIALIRSMKTTERDHARAIKLVRTGYPPTPAIQYPTWGSVMAWDRRAHENDLPSFVRVGKPRIATRDVSSGVLGSRFAAFRIDEPGTLPPDVRPTTPNEVSARRLALTNLLDAEFARSGAAAEVQEKRDIYDRSARFMLSPRLNVFNLDDEPATLRDAYGRTTFGQGCLLARRLVEAGVSFIEVFSSGIGNDQGWDTHNRGFTENPLLANETDPGYASLLKDLSERGMLENTLVVWMGEFGRTPRFKPDGGREHYSDGWQACLSGCGIRGGQVIGATDAEGVSVTERPVDIKDLFVSFCHALGMNPREEYVSHDQRPLKLVEGGEVVRELFS